MSTAHRAAPGASLRVSGRNLGAAALLVFYGERGPRDDVTAPATPANPGTRAHPGAPGARSGPVALIDLAGRRSRRWTGLLVEGMQPLLGTYQPAGVPKPVEAAVSDPRTLFYGGPSGQCSPTAWQQPMDLQVNLVRVTDGAVIRAWDRPAVTPGALNRVLWTGAVKGRVPRIGKYAFALSRARRHSCQRPRRTTRSEEAITVYDHMFPIRGAHDFGGAGADFGVRPRGTLAPGPGRLRGMRHAAGRRPRRHGQVRGFHAAAGYYVVIDGKGTGVDYAYMHLRERADAARRRPRLHGPGAGRGRRHRQRGGLPPALRAVDSPGWYDGGRPVDPLPDLKRWDRTS